MNKAPLHLLDSLNHSNAHSSDVGIVTTKNGLIASSKTNLNHLCKKYFKLESEVKLKGGDLLQGKKGQ